jgi:hypothetical protein
MKRIITAIVLFFSICVFGKEPAESTVPSNEKIHQMLTERLGKNTDHVGIAVGIIEPGGRRFVSA